MAVAGVGVAVERPAQVFERHQFRQPVGDGGFDLAEVFAQLGRDVIHAQRTVKLPLVTDLGQRGVPALFLGFGGDADAVVVDGPAVIFERVAAQGDVMFLAAGEMVQRVGIFRVADQPQVALDAVGQTHGHLRRSLWQ